MIDQKIIDVLRVNTPEENAALLRGASFDRGLYMEADGDVISGSKLLDRGKIITVRKHSRYIHFPEHKHDYVEVLYMVTGQTTHYVNGEKVVLKAGELLFMSQNAVQEIEAASENDIGVNFIIRPEFFDGTLAMLDGEDTPLRSFLLECFKGESSESSYLHFKVADVLPVQNLLENMMWLLVHEPHGRWKINQNTMGLLIMHLMNHTETLAHQTPEQKRKMQILSYIEENYREGSLEELCGILHYDFSALSREIKKTFGVNYTDLVQKKRIAQASFMLRSTNLSVADIGAEVGYENTSYFYRIFQKSCNMTPREYRKMYTSL